jgi:dimethylglycine dehydrogenase
VRERAGIMDVTAFTKVRCRGPRRRSAARPADGQPDAAETGRHRADPYAQPPRPDRTGNHGGADGEDRFYLVCAAFFEQRLLDHLAAHRNGADATWIINRCRRTGRAGAERTEGARHPRRLHRRRRSTMPRSAGCRRRRSRSPAPVWALRMSYAGELGWELHMPRDAICRPSTTRSGRRAKRTGSPTTAASP